MKKFLLWATADWFLVSRFQWSLIAVFWLATPEGYSVLTYLLMGVGVGMVITFANLSLMALAHGMEDKP